MDDTNSMTENYYQKNKKEILKRLKVRYRTDKKFREKAKSKYRERYHSDFEYKKKTLQNALNRYHTDEVYRKKTIERSKKRRKQQKLIDRGRGSHKTAQKKA